MRIRHWVLVGSASMVVVGMLAGGCGGSSENGPTQDAGNDITTTDVAIDNFVADTSADVTDSAACVSDADLLNFHPPDAALADGATSVGICLGCVDTSCSQQLQACNADCTCRSVIAGVLTCVAGGGALTQCAAGLITGNPPQTARDLGLCVIGSCQQECAPTPPKPDSGGDSGDASDGG